MGGQAGAGPGHRRRRRWRRSASRSRRGTQRPTVNPDGRSVSSIASTPSEAGQGRRPGSCRSVPAWLAWWPGASEDHRGPSGAQPGPDVGEDVDEQVRAESAGCRRQDPHRSPDRVRRHRPTPPPCSARGSRRPSGRPRGAGKPAHRQFQCRPRRNRQLQRGGDDPLRDGARARRSSGSAGPTVSARDGCLSPFTSAERRRARAFAPGRRPPRRQATQRGLDDLGVGLGPEEISLT